MKKLYASITNTTGIISVSINSSHSAQNTVANIEAINTSLGLNDLITIDLGYTDDHDVIFTGYVKNIEHRETPNIYIITCSDVLVRASDYFIVSTNPDSPYRASNISAEDLVEDMMDYAGITNYGHGTSSFTFAINNPLEVNMTSAYDYSRFIADIIAWQIYADKDGKVWFVDRKPYPMGADTPIATINLAANYILESTYIISDRDLRNRIVVYGSGGIYSEAKASSPYLPNGFYKSVAVAAPGVIDTQSMADGAASYNLTMLNRLTESLQISVVGDPALVCRYTVTILDSGSDLEDDWYLYSVDHTWGSGGYITSLGLRR